MWPWTYEGSHDQERTPIANHQGASHQIEHELEHPQNATAAGETLHPLLLKAQRDVLRSQLQDLREELADYEALHAGGQSTQPLGTLVELPRLLIQRRIAAGLSQKDLAERRGLKEQQVQRYEATEYASASFSRLVEVIHALDR